MNTNDPPYFTIIIATLNAESTLERCLKSIIQQTAMDRIEILIKDGGSNDKTLSIIRSYETYIKHWESSTDTSVYDAWNNILPKACGKWILFLGADDALFNNSIINKSYSILQKADESIDMTYGKVRLINTSNENILDFGSCWEKTKKCIYEKMCIPHQGVFHKRTLFSKYGYFNTDYKISSDYDFLRRTLREDNILYMDMIISFMQLGGISSNPQNTFARLKEIRHINKHYNDHIYPGKLWLITFTNACFRHALFFFIGENSGKYILDKFRRLIGLPLYWTKI